MLKQLLIALSIASVSCSSNDTSLEGEWTVDSPFYTATYAILPTAEGYTAQVMSYNDGTTHYTNNKQTPQYLFTNLVAKGEVYVDGSTGATSAQKETFPNIEIKKIHEDTLQATSYSMNQAIKEFWIRKKSK